MPAKREQIEAEIAKRIPRPTPAEYKDIAGRCAQLLDKDQVEAMIKTWKGWRDQIPRPAEYKDDRAKVIAFLQSVASGE